MPPKNAPRRHWLSGMRWVWSLGGLGPRELAARIWSAIDENDVLGRAAQLSFYFLLSLFPLLIFVSALLGHVFAGNAALYNELLRYLQTSMPAPAYQLVRTTVDEITMGTSGGKLSFGLAAALWTASSGMEALIDGLNVAYEVKERRPMWRRRLVAIALTVLVSVLTAAALFVVLSGGSFGTFVAGRWGFADLFGRTWVLIQFGSAPVFMFVVFTLLYRYAPNARGLGWQALMPGALAAVTLWLAASALLRLYLSVFDTYSRTYGSLGAVIVLLLWLHVSSAAVLIGAELNSAIRKAAAAAGVEEARAPIEAPGP